MPNEKDPFENLTAFEAAMASLAPRSDRIDRDRLMFLAGQVSADVGRDRCAASAGENRAMSAAIRPVVRRWAWPAAFGLMSAVAATLFAALASRPTSDLATQRPQPADVATASAREAVLPKDSERSLTANASAANDAQQNGQASLRSESFWIELLARAVEWARSVDRRATQKTYAEIRDAVLRDGIDAWASERGSFPAHGATTAVAQTPLTQQQLLDELLNQTPGGRKTRNHGSL
jgi:hypothetical protein